MPQIKVLLVEDNVAEANLIELQLAGAKFLEYPVIRAGKISDALGTLSDNTFDVILLDFHLPDNDDLGGLTRVLDVAGNAPVIMLTNHEDESTATEALRLGAQDYIFKRDIDTALLERSIRYAIERQSAQEALKISEERYSLALAAVNDGIWDWDLSTGTIYFSDRLYQMLGYENGEFTPTFENWLSKIHPSDRDKFEKTLDAHLVGAIAHLEIEHRLENKQGDYLWVLCRGLAIRNGEGKPVRMAGSLSDATQRKFAEQQLIHQALHDQLTSLPNRTLFLDRVRQAMAVSKRQREHQFAILFIDLNRFKSINDSLGHAVGNEFLKAVAERLSGEVRPTDTLARLSGDEFALLIQEFSDVNTVFQIADRLQLRLQQKFIIDGAELHIGASIGIATSSEKYQFPEELLRDADIAMYRAKHTGMAYEIFDAEMHDMARRRLKLENELRNAIERQEFVLYYQPILSLATRRISGFEALVRWRHPEAGLLSPGSFIKVAEETGLVTPIGWWVLEQACKDFTRFYQAFPSAEAVSVSVNVSGKTINSGEAATKLALILEKYNFNPALLHLEITEHAVMEHHSRALKELEKIRSLGVRLHIDDFGTGYSSLSHLRRFSYDTLKIDSSFVRDMITSSDNEAIVKSIIAMGKLMDMDIVAEGVETLDQLKWLSDMNCPQVQGYLFSRAVPSNQIESLLDQCRIDTDEN